jgi:hypothetical protein
MLRELAARVTAAPADADPWLELLATALELYSGEDAGLDAELAGGLAAVLTAVPPAAAAGDPALLASLLHLALRAFLFAPTMAAASPGRDGTLALAVAALGDRSCGCVGPAATVLRTALTRGGSSIQHGWLAAGDVGVLPGLMASIARGLADPDTVSSELQQLAAVLHLAAAAVGAQVAGPALVGALAAVASPATSAAQQHEFAVAALAPEAGATDVYRCCFDFVRLLRAGAAAQ